MIEWYDFYIFGSLAAVMSARLFPGKVPTWDLIKTGPCSPPVFRLARSRSDASAI